VHRMPRRLSVSGAAVKPTLRLPSLLAEVR
jgi:hypothetical protein